MRTIIEQLLQGLSSRLLSNVTTSPPQGFQLCGGDGGEGVPTPLQTGGNVNAEAVEWLSPLLAGPVTIAAKINVDHKCVLTYNGDILPCAVPPVQLRSRWQQELEIPGCGHKCSSFGTAITYECYPGAVRGCFDIAAVRAFSL